MVPRKANARLGDLVSAWQHNQSAEQHLDANTSDSCDPFTVRTGAGFRRGIVVLLVTASRSAAAFTASERHSGRSAVLTIPENEQEHWRSR
jgi:hypothetical protein